MSHGLDAFGCLSNAIKVASGHYVDLLNPEPESIDIKSIAAALSKVCRFGGHSPRFYSVAEHCIHATVLATKSEFTGDALRAVFLHDAAEAYIGDMVKPLKVMIPAYEEFERRIEGAIQVAFDVDFDRWHKTIKRFDRAMLKAEKVSMWPEDAETWSGFGEIPDVAVEFQFWTPETAESQFLAMAELLGFEVPA